MTTKIALKALVVVSALCFLGLIDPGASSVANSAQSKDVPRIIDAGPVGGPPSDAIVLFDGTDLAEWRGRNGEAKWEIKDGVLTIVPGTGQITTKRSFGDIQLHMEWRTPADARGGGESRGNSGIKFHTAYEIQILDSYQNRSNPKGQAGAVYKQHAPLVNASRKPGEWQSYDIVFRAPFFDEDGKLQKHGTFTVFHNGVLVQDRARVFGRTNSRVPVSPEYRQPFFIQDHGSRVSFRNIWVRELKRQPQDW